MYKPTFLRLFLHHYRMKTFIVSLLVSVSVASLPFALAADAAPATQWRARLTPNPVSFGTRDTITGIGEVRAELDGNTLSLHGSFQGLQGKATAVKIHQGPKAIPGPAILDLNLEVDGDGKQGRIDAVLTLSDEQVRALRAESLYLQIYSEVAKEGNLRGWLVSEDGRQRTEDG